MFMLSKQVVLGCIQSAYATTSGRIFSPKYNLALIPSGLSSFSSSFDVSISLPNGYRFLVCWVFFGWFLVFFFFFITHCPLSFTVCPPAFQHSSVQAKNPNTNTTLTVTVSEHCTDFSMVRPSRTAHEVLFCSQQKQNAEKKHYHR